MAQILDVDAVVIGAVTDYSPYYPPRCALQVEWYAANPGFHPIPPGYGLDAQGRRHGRADMARRMGADQALQSAGHMATGPTAGRTRRPAGDATTSDGDRPAGRADTAARPARRQRPAWLARPARIHPAAAEPGPPRCCPAMPGAVTRRRTTATTPISRRPWPSYYFFRDDARFGGWQSYLQRSDDFIRFCCHMHIREMLTAPGRAGETRVVWRWPTIR